MGITNLVVIVVKETILHTELQEENSVLHGTNIADFVTKEDIFRKFAKLLLRNMLMNLKLMMRC